MRKFHQLLDCYILASNPSRKIKAVAKNVFSIVTAHSCASVPVIPRSILTLTWMSISNKVVKPLFAEIVPAQMIAQVPCAGRRKLAKKGRSLFLWFVPAIRSPQVLFFQYEGIESLRDLLANLSITGTSAIFRDMAKTSLPWMQVIALAAAIDGGFASIASTLQG